MTEAAAETYTVYRLYDAERNLLYVGCTKNLENRLTQRRHTREWFPAVASVETEEFGNRQDATSAEFDRIRKLAPLHNGARLVPYPDTVTTERLDGAKVRRVRIERRYSQREVAGLARLTTETINRIERKGEPRTVYSSTVRKLSQALDVDPAEILAD